MPWRRALWLDEGTAQAAAEAAPVPFGLGRGGPLGDTEKKQNGWKTGGEIGAKSEARIQAAIASAPAAGAAKGVAQTMKGPRMISACDRRGGRAGRLAAAALKAGADRDMRLNAPQCGLWASLPASTLASAAIG